MKLRMKNVLIYLSILFVLVSVVLWLNQNYFFLSLNNSDFNNLLTPIIALFSVILLIFTLSDSQKYNSRQLAINEYNILFQDFELIKIKLEKLKFEVDTNGFSDSFKKSLEESDGINYISLFSQFLNFELGNKNDTNQLIGKFRIGVIFPFIRNYKNLGIFLNEVIQNDVLSDRYKAKFYIKVEQQLLQCYFRICNNIDQLGKPNYDLSLFDSEVYKSAEFLEINDLYIKNNLFQMNDLDFYIKTL